MWALVASILVLLVFVAIQYGCIVLIEALRKRFWKDFSTQYPPHYNYDSSYVSGDNSFTLLSNTSDRGGEEFSSVCCNNDCGADGGCGDGA